MWLEYERKRARPNRMLTKRTRSVAGPPTPLQHAQTLNVMRAAWKLTDADQGVKKLEQLARFLVTRGRGTSSASRPRLEKALSL